MSTAFEGSLNVSYNTTLSLLVPMHEPTSYSMHTVRNFFIGIHATKSPKSIIVILLHNINIRMLPSALECCSIQRFIRV